MGKDSEIRVGKKPISNYVNAVLYCVDNFGEAELRGLKTRQAKVLEIKDRIKDLEEFEQMRISDALKFEDDGAPGVKIIFEKEV